ncbi:hypothetical protein [Pseudonocardia asaccharolytica]|uniref:Membrane protein YmcC n=1 Tax=Pseudonocardia asaccharolytica DSM 44247 = NBRC 16224 TaxID=1123024 RepID=A0A511CWW0_9PSEU|nr:hypothetical protein [Pseudonocardia asaccharolytica]GEL17050.1 hypothetical protein PA7_08870 [Pseudonocardia asaccharolytica DSM 44247 = NBRC 16224]
MGSFLNDNPLLLLIAACEIGFWVLLAAGLFARYVLRQRRLSTGLLLGVPVLDVVLVAASVADIAGGSRPGLTHGLAVVYLGFTVAFGHSIVRWADAQFAHRFAGGPPPPRPPQHGSARVAHEWREWGKAVLAWTIAVGAMLVMATVAGIGVPAPTDWLGDPFWSWAGRISVVVGIWFVGWPLWTTLNPPRERVADRVR